MPRLVTNACPSPHLSGTATVSSEFLPPDFDGIGELEIFDVWQHKSTERVDRAQDIEAVAFDDRSGGWIAEPMVQDEHRAKRGGPGRDRVKRLPPAGATALGSGACQCLPTGRNNLMRRVGGGEADRCRRAGVHDRAFGGDDLDRAICPFVSWQRFIKKSGNRQVDR